MSVTEKQVFDSVPEVIRRALESRIADMKLEPGHRLGLKSGCSESSESPVRRSTKRFSSW